MSIFAVYRCLYGEDFIQQSIRSILPHVDKVFFFWDDRTWSEATGCTYKGKWVEFPKPFPGIPDAVLEMKEPKVEVIFDHWPKTPRNQFTHLVNDIIIPKHGKPDELMVLEVDHIFRKDQIEEAIREFRDRCCQCATTRQVEVWKGFCHRVPERPHRVGTMFWNLRELEGLPPTKLQADTPGRNHLSAFVHNFGFAFGEETMYWKHLTAIANAGKIGDSCVDRYPHDWYDKKWLAWDYETNNKDLEQTKGYEHQIPCVVPYDVGELPKGIK